MSSAKDIIEIASALSIASLSTVSLIGILTSPMRKRIERKVGEWDSMVRVVHNELIPNGGGSLKDQVTRMDERLKRVEDQNDGK